MSILSFFGFDTSSNEKSQDIAVSESLQNEETPVLQTELAVETLFQDTGSEPEQRAPAAWVPNYGSSPYSNSGPVVIRSGVYNGEKTNGSLGNPINLLPDHGSLRARSYEAFLTNDSIRIAISPLLRRIIGSGLTMQAEPHKKLLELENVKEDLEAFTLNVETYWEVWAKSKRVDIKCKHSLHELAQQHEETKLLGGDDLVILRIDEKYNLKVQVVDGQHVKSPPIGHAFTTSAKASGHKIIQGVEINPSGEYVAFYVEKENYGERMLSIIYELERIPAKNDEGITMAWMGYGMKLRIDHHRGIPITAAILEKTAKLDRYTEATVSTAEERAKVVYVLEHGRTSDGSNPLADNIKARLGSIASDGSAEAKIVAQAISVTEERQVHSLAPDQSLKAVSSRSEIQYDPFFNAIFTQICATVGTPPEVALQKYNSNYSASRAAILAFQDVVALYRSKCGNDFYGPIYFVWLYIHILKNKVSAEKYLQAWTDDNMDVVEAYSGAKFTGINMPHIDPLKEMNAIRAALGEGYKNMPLISLEQATEQAGAGDWESNASKLSQEIKLAKKLKVVPEEQQTETKDSDAAND
jgi:capsid protein